MTMDEFRAALRARQLVSKLALAEVPANLDAYCEELGCRYRIVDSLPAGNSGMTLSKGSAHVFLINKQDEPRRQRFTVCHELGHVALALPSRHAVDDWLTNYKRRPPEEVYCDIFAAELLLPHGAFGPLVDEERLGFDHIDELGDKFEASATAVGLRLPAYVKSPCAFVLSQEGKVRYVSYSQSLRERRAWIAPRSLIPKGTPSAAAASGESTCCEETPADFWFSDWRGTGSLYEEARFLPRWGQTLTLLWAETDTQLSGHGRASEAHEEEEPLLRELDGNLPWPGRRRRR